MGEWKKVGRIFNATGQFDWMQSHASNPIPYITNDGLLRIYFTTRNAKSQGHIGFAEFNPATFECVKITDTPVIIPGEPGLFDEDGVTSGCLLKEEGILNLYYLGWNLKVSVPWLNTIGKAVSNDDGISFKKTSKAPMHDRSDADPYSLSYPSVIKHEGEYHMWYGSNLGWGKERASMKHVIKHAKSSDGEKWQCTGIAVGLKSDQEYAISRPCVIRSSKDGGGLYEMWYSYRASDKSDEYRIGYATSEDANQWVRKDELAGIDVGANGEWDSDMVCYAYIFELQGARCMVYNGNGYGKTGFGIAKWIA